MFKYVQVLLIFSLCALSLNAMNKSSEEIPSYAFKSEKNSLLSEQEKQNYNTALRFAYGHLRDGHTLCEDFIKQINAMVRANIPPVESDMQPGGIYRTREILVYRESNTSAPIACIKYGADFDLLSQTVSVIQTFPNKTTQSLVREGLITEQKWENLNKIIYIPPEPLEVPGLMKNYLSHIEAKINTQESIRKIAAYIHSELGLIHPFDTGNGRTATVVMQAYLLAHNETAIALPSQSMVINSDNSEAQKYISAIRETRNNAEAFEEYLASRKECHGCHIWKQNLKNCSRCKKVFYCDSSCQKLDWNTHKTSCK